MEAPVREGVKRLSCGCFLLLSGPTFQGGLIIVLHPTNRRKLHCPSLLSSSRILPLLLIAALLLLKGIV
jgi:hypothetical protein